MSKNIIFVCDHLKGGGAERINIEMAKKFLEKGFLVTFILMDGSSIGIDDIDGVEIYDLKLKMTNNVFRQKGKNIPANIIECIKKIEEKLKPELVLISFCYAYWIKDYFQTINKWLWIHSDLTQFNAKERSKNFLEYLNVKRRIYLEKKGFYKLFANEKIIVVNTDLAEFYTKYSSPDEIYFLPNGIDIKDGGVKKNIEKEYDVIYAGRLSEEKRVHIAIKAFLKSNISGKMVIVGDGPLRKQLENLVDKIDKNKKIVFLGWRNDVYSLIQKSKILLLTSRIEGFPMVILESLYLGTPVVTYNISSGIEYQLSSGDLRKGLVNYNDFIGLVDTLNQVYNHPYQITEKDKFRLSLDCSFNQLLNIVGLN